MRHVVRTVKPDEMMDALPLIVWYLDDPVADPALVPLWFIAREARQHVKVVLSGEGADELFGGYTIYREPLSLAPFERLPGGLRCRAGPAVHPDPGGRARQGPAAARRAVARAALLRQRAGVPGRAPGGRDAISSTPAGRTPRSPPSTTAHSAGWDPVARMQHVDLFTWLRGDILVKADKMTMAHSLELRVPFLDPEVFAVACELPLDEKIGAGTTKYALRRALADVVPAHVLNRRKLGFPVPIRHWLRDEMYDWAP